MILNRRQQPTTHVFIDLHNRAKAHGYRVIRTTEDAYWSPYGSDSPMEGWVKSESSYSLGIDLEVEADRGELVFPTCKEAHLWAKGRGWTVVNECKLQ